MSNVLPFRLPRDRAILYRSAPLRRTGFVIVWIPAEEPTARVIVWDGLDYGDALIALAEWDRDGADVSEELAVVA